MSELTLNHNARLTDALERDLLRGALERQPNAHPLTSLKKAGHAVAGAIGSFFDFIDEVNESMNRARAASARFSGSQW
ncbi:MULTISPECIES: hypothetical protein [unclassified Achromobacter]|uniref:hypothetical protein n=1 Tax=unclassified Achromobacter TaxID=2626865 RepID=UPI00069FF1DD|nr:MULTISPECIES: hypothetical protein [unclassified Achromobacter]KOF53867.1 hypothetical protein AD428_10705 [Achromobacter sp. DMS1]